MNHQPPHLSVPSENSDPIDPQAWSDLRALGGEDADEMVEELIGMYLEDGVTLLEKIRSDHRSAQPLALSRSAHALRSPSATIGALQLADRCRQLEERSGQGDLPEEDQISELMNEAERVFTALRSRSQRR